MSGFLPVFPTNCRTAKVRVSIDYPGMVELDVDDLNSFAPSPEPLKCAGQTTHMITIVRGGVRLSRSDASNSEKQDER